MDPRGIKVVNINHLIQYVTFYPKRWRSRFTFSYGQPGSWKVTKNPWIPISRVTTPVTFCIRPFLGVSKNRGTPKWMGVGPPQWMTKIMERSLLKWMIWGYHHSKFFPAQILQSSLDRLLRRRGGGSAGSWTLDARTSRTGDGMTGWDGYGFLGKL